jgi:hypothetical protein
LRRLARLASPLRRLLPFEPLLYALWAAAATLASARRFYGFMMKQTGGEWSAPLDDVFIHFDYARATAHGHPFEWVAGNGYSSGNTSITYPFVLAIGYLAGFRQERLMLWAAIVAATCVLSVLLAVRHAWLALGAPGATLRATTYLLPPALLGIGALDWTLWSGMEVAFFLSTWALGLMAYVTLALEQEPSPRHEWSLGAAGALMVLTRPEAVSTVAVFALCALLHAPRVRGVRDFVPFFARTLGPAAASVVLLAVVNRALTGEWTANGAIVKLAVYNPFLTREAKWDDYVFNFRYEIFRNLEYHFTDSPVYGFIVPGLGLAALAIPGSRRLAMLLWGQVLGWTAFVALNGQVRWQNERYTMPAVAWLALVAAIGAGALICRTPRPSLVVTAGAGILAAQAIIASKLPESRPTVAVGWGLSLLAGAVVTLALWLRPARVLVAALLVGLFHVHQESRMRDQKWFFGRACRNIRDQHIEMGRWLEALHPRRILVGDAGALIYASARPGLDIIGLGGYHALPFARASVQGLTATIELMERMSPDDLPDVLAIYPSWWGILPTWFSSGVIQRMPAVGNVICGGYEDVVYVADWHLLGTGDAPRLVPRGLDVKDGVDIADLVSEKEHHYVFAAPESGFTDMKVLADPVDPDKDMLDGGRELKPGFSESMRLSGLSPNVAASLLIRAAPASAASLRISVNGETLAPVTLERHDGWVEPRIDIPARLVKPTLDVAIENVGADDFVDFHVWALQ